MVRREAGNTGRRLLAVVLLAAIAVALLLLLRADLFDGRVDAPSEPADLRDAGGPLDASGSAARPPRGLGAASTSDPGSERSLAASWSPECVQGRVVDTRRSPVSGAAVTLHPLVPGAQGPWVAGGRAVGEARSKGDGTFAICPAPADRVLVRAVADGYTPAVVSLPSRGAQVEVVLERGGSLELVVLDADGRPVEAALATHSAIVAAMPVVATATTDAHGAARFDALTTGTGHLLVEKSGVGTLRKTDVAIAGGRTTRLVLVLEAARELVGTVTDAASGRVVSGATVDAAYPVLPDHAPPPPATSDGEGRYRLLLDVAPGEAVRLRARHPKYADTVAWLNVTDTVVDAIHVDLALGPAFPPLAGRVVRADGRGVAGAVVTHWMPAPGEVPPAVTTADDGRFEIAPPAGSPAGAKVALIASSLLDGVGTAWTVVSSRDSPPPQPLEIRVNGSGTLEGKVVDAAGSPAAGAVVTASVDWEGMQRRGVARGVRTGDWTTFQALQDAEVLRRLTSVTDRTGRFLLSGIPAAWYRVTARWGSLAAASEPAEVAAGGTTRADLALAESLQIDGVVLDAEEKPVPGVVLWAQPGSPGPGGSAVPPGVRSQEDGRFVLRGVSAGVTYTVHASATGYGEDHARDVSAGARGVTLRLRALGWVEGQVLRDGDPVATPFTIRLVRKGADRTDGRPESGFASGPGLTRTFRGPEGAFRLPATASGEYVLSAFTPDGRWASKGTPLTVVEGRGTSSLRLSLERSARIRGDVVGIDGKPLADAWLQVFRDQETAGEDGPVGGTRSGDDGKFSVDGLGGGTYVVRVGADRGSPWTERVEVRAGEEAHVHFARRAAARVRFTVVDAEGRPVAGAKTVLVDAVGVAHVPDRSLLARDGLLDPLDRTATSNLGVTDAAGLSTRHHVSPGRYRASAALGKVAADPVRVEIDPGSTAEVRIVLRVPAR